MGKKLVGYNVKYSFIRHDAWILICSIECYQDRITTFYGVCYTLLLKKNLQIIELPIGLIGRS